MDKRSKTQGNKRKTSASASIPAEDEQRAPPVASPTAEIEQIIADIQGDLRSAKESNAYALGERLRGRLIQAERLRSNVLGDMRKHELRLVDSAEWQQLSAKLARMVGGCDRCRVAVLKLLEEV